jgi:hypothetical protein
MFSFGKKDEWKGPAQSASMTYSNNAENIYAFHINRAKPLCIPLLSRFIGPFHYEFMVSALRSHTMIPNPAYTWPASNQPNVINPSGITLNGFSAQVVKRIHKDFEIDEGYTEALECLGLPPRFRDCDRGNGLTDLVSSMQD